MPRSSSSRHKFLQQHKHNNSSKQVKEHLDYSEHVTSASSKRIKERTDTEWLWQEDLPNPQLDKEREKRTRRKRDDSDEKDKYPNDVRDSTIASSRRKSSLVAASHFTKDQYRHGSKLNELKYKESVTEERIRDAVPDRVYESRSMDKPKYMEKPIYKDKNQPSTEKSPIADAQVSPLQLKEKSHSSTSIKRRHSNRTPVRWSFDVEGSGHRRSGSKDARDYSAIEDRGSQEWRGTQYWPSEKPAEDDFSQQDGDTVSVSSSFNRTDWEQNRHMMTDRGWEVSAELWKGQNSGISMEFPSASQKEDNYLCAPVDEVWAGKFDRSRSISRAESIDINISDGIIPEINHIEAPKQVVLRKTPETSETVNDNGFCHVYHSKLDTSVELTDMKMYKQCRSRMDIEGDSADGDVYKDLSIEENGKAEMNILNTNLTAPLFPAIKDSVLQKKIWIKEEEQEEIIEDIETKKTFSGSEDPMLSSDDDMPPEGHRIKILNLDWSQVRAYHLYFLMDFYVPEGGEVLSVAIYSSDVEAAKAPAESIHSDNSRCYFAVVECDSCATADYIYETCDGMKIKITPDVLDLYLIPDSVKFEHPPHDVVTKGAKIMDYMKPPEEIEVEIKVEHYYWNGSESRFDDLVLRIDPDEL